MAYTQIPNSQVGMPERAREIISQTDRIGAALDRLQQASSHLRDRLSPVSSDRTGLVNASADSKNPDACVLGGQLARFAECIETEAAGLERMAMQLEL